MDPLKLTIKPKGKYSDDSQSIAHSAGYDCVIGDWKLGKGVKKLTLEMDAFEKPKLTIEAEVDRMEIEAIYGLGLELIDTSDNQNQVLTTNEVAELAELRSLRRSNNNFKVLNDRLKQKEKQNSILSIALVGLAICVTIVLLYCSRSY